MYKIAFMARPPMDRFAAEIFREIRASHDDGAIGYFFTCDEKETAKARQYLDNDEHMIICQLNEFMNAHWDEFTVDKLQFFEQEYDCAPVWKYIYTDRFLIHRGYDYAVRTACGLFAFWEHIFKDLGVQYYYDETVGTLVTYIAYIVAKKYGALYFTLLQLRGRELTDHFYITDPFQYQWGFDDNYKNKSYSEEQKEEAREYLRVNTSKPQPDYMKLIGQRPRIKGRFFLLPPFYIRQRFFNKHTVDKGSYIYYKSYENVLDPIKFYCRYQKCKKYFKDPVPGQKYVIYPLHYQPEASTIVCAPKYEKQLFFIDSLAKSLPADTVLYVKEHYVQLGHRPESFYKDLQQLPNVVLINPWADGKKLLQESECIATLTGTCGWEGILMRKPVIMCGDVFYRKAPGVLWSDEIIDNYMDLMNSYVQPTEDELIQYLCAFLEVSRKGNVFPPDINRFNHDNIVMVANSIMDFIKKNEVKAVKNEY